jgi:general stress protein 26
MYEKLGDRAVMALASSLNDHVTVRSVSCIFIENRLFFKTDKNFYKTKQLLANPNTALCVGGVQIEGAAEVRGPVKDEPVFEELYKKYWDKSYNAYAHEESEILVEVTPKFAEIWDQDEDYRGFQTFIDFETEEAAVRYYD